MAAVRENKKGSFYYSSQMVFPWAPHFVRLAMAREDENDEDSAFKFFLVCGADATHVSHISAGMNFLLVMVDANRNTVPLAWAHFADNESDATWLSFMQWAKINLPELDADNVTLVRDGSKSISKARSAEFSETHGLYCVRHASEAAQHTVSGGAIASEYVKLALALTTSSQDHVKQNSTPQALIDYINRAAIPDGQRLLAQFGILGGHVDATFSDRRGVGVDATFEPRHTASFVESNNWSAIADGSRSFEPVAATLQTAMTWTKRMMANQLAAQGCLDLVPPQVEKLLKHLRKMADDGVANHTTKVELLPGPSVCGHVKPRLDLGGMSFLCNLNTKTCACGFSRLTGFPCPEMAILAKAMGRLDWLRTRLVNEQDKTRYWQSQYDFDFAACMPSPAEVWHGAVDMTLLMPGALPRKAGRPKVARHKSPMEKKSKTRLDGSDKKPRNIYKCKACGQPKKGHTCPAKAQG